jgi:nuclear cap-binding protein subunit 1
MFAILFTLQPGTLHHSACGAFIADLVKAEVDLQKLLGRGLIAIYKTLPSLDIEIRDRFANWFAVHLSNFSFSFPWKIWTPVLEYDPTNPQRVFLSEVFERITRLGVWDVVKKQLPEDFHSMLPPKPSPLHKYASKKNVPILPPEEAVEETPEQKEAA